MLGVACPRRGPAYAERWRVLRVIVATFRNMAFAGLCVVIATPVSAASLVGSWDGTNLTLGPKPTRAVLQLAGHMTPAALAERAKAHRYTLVLSGLAADPDPETGYLVFLNLSQSAKPSKDDEGYVGAISFFGMPRSGSSAIENAQFRSLAASRQPPRTRPAQCPNLRDLRSNWRAGRRQPGIGREDRSL